MDLPELSDGLPVHQSIVIFVNDFGGVPGLHGSEIFVASLCVEITDKGVAEPTRLPRLQSGSFLDFLAQSLSQRIVVTAPHDALETAFPRVNGWLDVAKFFGLKCIASKAE
jgi:hypothetical protein